MSHLTEVERNTLLAAEDILIRFLARENESILLSLHHGWKRIGFTYFSPNKVQHGSCLGENFAEKLEYAASVRDDEDGRADQIRADRIEKLRKQLSELTGDAA